MITILIFILGGCFSLAFLLVSSLPSFDITLPFTAFNVLQDLFNGIAFFLPMNTIATIFSIKLAVVGFRFAWAIILRIKSFIPLLGGD